MMAIQSVTPQSFINLQLGAGAFLSGLDPDAAQDAGALRALLDEALSDPRKRLGATAGGGSFTASPRVRRFEMDNCRSPAVGGVVVEGWDISLSTTLKEISGDNLARALAAAEPDGAGTRLRLRNALQGADYMSSFCWAGDLLDGRTVLIALDNALCLSGASLLFSEGEEGSLPVVFKAHQNAFGAAWAPCRIYFIERA